ncbi:hypothetical protein D3C84_1202230 [compost metagenome]
MCVDRSQTPIGIEFSAAPTVGIACSTVFHVRRRLRGTEGGQCAEQGKVVVLVVHPVTVLSCVAKSCALKALIFICETRPL